MAAISARLAPLPPSRLRNSAPPSLCPAPKLYTHLVMREVPGWRADPARPFQSTIFLAPSRGRSRIARRPFWLLAKPSLPGLSAARLCALSIREGLEATDNVTTGRSTLDFREIGYPVNHGANPRQQRETIAAQAGFRRVDRYAIEESVERRAEGGHRRHCSREVFRLQPSCDQRFGARQRLAQRPLLRLREQRRVGGGFVGAVLALLDAQDVRGATIGGQQVGAVLAPEQRRDRRRPREQAHDVVVVAGREDGVQHVVPRSLGAQLNAHPLGEEPEQVVRIVRAGGEQQGAQTQAQAVLARDAQHAECRPAQRVGIARSGGLLVGVEELRQLIELVG